jgi:D-alanine-D-alanine ligase
MDRGDDDPATNIRDRGPTIPLRAWRFMRICILDDAYESSASPLRNYDLTCDPTPFLGGHDCETVPLVKQTAVEKVIELSRGGFDLFFNLCDGAWGDDRPGIEVVQALERLGLAFTGATSEFYEPSREAMKRVCAAWGIDTPGYVIATEPSAVERAADTLRFPLIVKHHSSYSSIDMTRASRVESVGALRERAAAMMAKHGGALIEEFVEGREFTVLVAEDPDDPLRPVTFTPIEVLFPAGESFKHFDLKWVDYHGMTERPVEDAVLEGRLRRVSADFFVGLRGASYGRCDLRMDAEGRLHMLEMNPNCGVYYPATDPGSADLALKHDPRGHQGFTDLVVHSALARHARRDAPWCARARGPGNYGLYATRRLEEREVVVRYEATPHVLVSRAHAETCWDERRLDWFRRYAWPLTDDVYVAWSEEPEDWRPINHSCDPNTWLEGLDLVARRAIPEGEELTVDYATFMGESMPPFECGCGTADCRGTVRGADHLQPFLEHYGTHVSDWVRRRREGTGGAPRGDGVASPRRATHTEDDPESSGDLAARG